ncbi:bifunctional glutamate N-acetyltransferase/amino-acid acetyltransferase ArgJ [Helicobacter sp. MIT 14-3879]|uniref:bifunctional glutamate N-acetyltransferase/amino-acid acetyltransferase ArgJ n=1 Tax=Helicobacter sp. MIT 14-3879 TaxID=2040649 RepID=UPI000E1E95BE|nr:bifunctional glutamate N-acetyltransferase/amino-acid acetyltransferase ArgJ [Helicobacter sp. MIT 14-3879]RDU64664.1 bifunctional ornithine acetyltransferase/N-acetylglutamate synthase [Helicobacter sp. MIT 14-3879]
MFDITPIKGGITAIDEVYCDGVSAGLKPNNALDIAFIYTKNLCNVETIFTNNLFRAAPIEYFLENSKDKQSNFILINTKNANAMTGERGKSDVGEILEELKKTFPKIVNPIMSSTGVIGQYLPKEKIVDSFKLFNLKAKNSINASNAILTTDRFNKEIALRVDLFDDNNIPSGSFKIAAMAKGAGMIEPNMATMLCFIITDANIPKNDMKTILNKCVSTTFNAISVDGDTSTNDSIFLLSNQNSNAYDKEAFEIALEMVMKKLSIDIVSDGEGSTKVVAFEVKNALNKSEAIKASKALSNSLLVKTAIFGGDPNWGRIASTIGSCGIKANAKKLKIYIGEIPIYECEKIYFENETKAAKEMQKDSFKITCDLGISEDIESSFIAYGCDLGHKYVEINSDYRS